MEWVLRRFHSNRGDSLVEWTVSGQPDMNIDFYFPVRMSGYPKRTRIRMGREASVYGAAKFEISFRIVGFFRRTLTGKMTVIGYWPLLAIVGLEPQCRLQLARTKYCSGTFHASNVSPSMYDDIISNE